MIFRFNDKEYTGSTATEVVGQMILDETKSDEKGGTIREYVTRSLKNLSDRLPPRELGISPSVSDEVQARNYLSLRHDFGIGELIDN